MNDLWPRRVVWSIYGATLIVLVWWFTSFASPIPLAEDWFTVAPLTGHEPSLLAWLWSQNNEHRMPVARLAILGALKLSGGDFRAGGFANLMLLAAAAAGLIAFMRSVRGRTDWADAFFPLLLLNFGQSHQLLFTFQLTSLLASLTVVALGCALFATQSVTTPRAAAVAGIAILLLPLSGLIGVFFIPPLLPFVLYAGLATHSGWRGWPRRPAIGRWLIAACAGAAVLTTFYFVGYEHPWWNPPNPGVVPSTKTALKVLSLGFGPAAVMWWPPAVLIAVVLVAVSHWQALRRVWHQRSSDRERAMGAALFLAAATLFALAVGWGRAGDEPRFGIPIRYILIALPAAIGAYLAWAVSPGAAGQFVTRSLAILLLVLWPLNTAAGKRSFADWYHEGMQRVEADLARGVTIEQLAAEHQPFLVHWWTPAELARHMRMLHDAGFPPFQGR